MNKRKEGRDSEWMNIEMCEVKSEAVLIAKKSQMFKWIIE